MQPFILLAIGLLLIFIEFFIPGAVIGVIGTILVLSSMVLFAFQSTSLLATLSFILGAIVVVFLIIRFALWRIVHTKPSYSIYSDQDQEGYKASSFDPTAIGKLGLVDSDLKPGGYIIVEGQRHQALSVAGYIPKGEEVAVIGGKEESLIVKLNNKENIQ